MNSFVDELLTKDSTDVNKLPDWDRSTYKSNIADNICESIKSTERIVATEESTNVCPREEEVKINTLTTKIDGITANTHENKKKAVNKSRTIIDNDKNINALINKDKRHDIIKKEPEEQTDKLSKINKDGQIITNEENPRRKPEDNNQPSYDASDVGDIEISRDQDIYEIIASDATKDLTDDKLLIDEKPLSEGMEEEKNSKIKAPMNDTETSQNFDVDEKYENTGDSKSFLEKDIQNVNDSSSKYSADEKEFITLKEDEINKIRNLYKSTDKSTSITSNVFESLKSTESIIAAVTEEFENYYLQEEEKINSAAEKIHETIVTIQESKEKAAKKPKIIVYNEKNIKVEDIEIPGNEEVDEIILPDDAESEDLTDDKDKMQLIDGEILPENGDGEETTVDNNFSYNEDEVPKIKSYDATLMQSLSARSQRIAKSVKRFKRSKNEGNHGPTQRIRLNDTTAATVTSIEQYTENNDFEDLLQATWIKNDENNANPSLDSALGFPKNVDPQMFINDKTKNRCVVCNKNFNGRLVRHYVNDHPGCEIYNSRLAPSQIEIIKHGRCKVSNTSIIRKQKYYEAFCIFCQMNLSLFWRYWYQHFTRHTGEFAYHCRGCGLRNPRRQDFITHLGCPKPSIAQDYFHTFKSYPIEANVCNLCNYVQLDRSNIERHLHTQHNIERISPVHIQTIALLSLPTSMTATSTGSISAAPSLPKNIDPQMFICEENKDRCVICNQVFMGRLVYHYVNDHRGCEVYNSRLSPSQIKLVKQGRCRVSNTSVIKRRKYYEASCIFCEKKLRITLPHWYQHFIRHTGEFTHRCTGCGMRRAMRDLRSHLGQGCPKARIAQDYVCLKTFPIEATVCNLCNYVQLHRSNIERHLHTQHDIEQILPEQIQTIAILSIPTSMTATSTKSKIDSKRSNKRGAARSLLSTWHTSKTCDIDKYDSDNDVTFEKIAPQESPPQTNYPTINNTFEEFISCHKATGDLNNSDGSSSLVLSSYAKKNQEGITIGDDNENNDNPLLASAISFPKNVDPQMFICEENKDRCVICNQYFTRRLVDHYVNEHRGCEIYNSRLSPSQIKLVKQGRCSVSNTSVIRRRKHYEGLCIFCQKKLRFTFPYWYEHFTRHTGEFAYRCTRCGLRRSMPDFRKHLAQGCPKARIAQDHVCLKSFPIEATVCNLCNYLQLDRSNIERHLHTQHDIEQILVEHIQTIALLSIPTSMTATSTKSKIDSRRSNKNGAEPSLPSSSHTPKTCVIGNDDNDNDVNFEKIAPQESPPQTNYPTINNTFEEFISCHKATGDLNNSDGSSSLLLSAYAEKIQEGITIDDDNENKDNPSLVSAMSFPKNVDPQMFINDENKDRCVICNKDFIGHLVYHYVNEHRGCEIYNSRLSPSQITLVKQGRCRVSNTSINKRQKYYEAFCIFCQKNLCLISRCWYQHFAQHTGEFAYRCTGCGLGSPMPDFKKHLAQGCPKARVAQDYICFKSFPIEANVCNLCNYVQLHRSNVQSHLHTQHNIEKIVPEHIQTIALLSIPTTLTAATTGSIIDSSPEYEEINEVIIPGDAETEELTDDEDKEQMVDEEILLESVEDEKNCDVNEKHKDSGDNKSFLNNDVQDLNDSSSKYSEGDEREFISLEDDELTKIRDLYKSNHKSASISSNVFESLKSTEIVVGAATEEFKSVFPEDEENINITLTKCYETIVNIQENTKKSSQKSKIIVDSDKNIKAEDIEIPGDEEVDEIKIPDDADAADLIDDKNKQLTDEETLNESVEDKYTLDKSKPTTKNKSSSEKKDGKESVHCYQIAQSSYLNAFQLQPETTNTTIYSTSSSSPYPGINSLTSSALSRKRHLEGGEGKYTPHKSKPKTTTKLSSKNGDGEDSGEMGDYRKRSMRNKRTNRLENSFSYNEDYLLAEYEIDEEDEKLVQVEIQRKIEQMRLEALRQQQVKSFENASIQPFARDSEQPTTSTKPLKNAPTQRKRLNVTTAATAMSIAQTENNDVEDLLQATWIENHENDDDNANNDNTSFVSAVGFPKNIDPQIFINDENKDRCVICNQVFTGRLLVLHYVNEHRGCEIYNSRLSPSQIKFVKQGRCKVSSICFNRKQKYYEAFCIFCQKNYGFMSRYWYQHFTRHTGEFAYRCTGCGLRRPVHSFGDHHAQGCEEASVAKDYLFYLKSFPIEATVCNICNYVQLHRSNIEKHLHTQHNIEQILPEHIQTVVLLSIPTSMTASSTGSIIDFSPGDKELNKIIHTGDAETEDLIYGKDKRQLIDEETLNEGVEDEYTSDKSKPTIKNKSSSENKDGEDSVHYHQTPQSNYLNGVQLQPETTNITVASTATSSPFPNINSLPSSVSIRKRPHAEDEDEHTPGKSKPKAKNKSSSENGDGEDSGKRTKCLIEKKRLDAQKQVKSFENAFIQAFARSSEQPTTSTKAAKNAPSQRIRLNNTTAKTVQRFKRSTKAGINAPAQRKRLNDTTVAAVTSIEQYTENNDVEELLQATWVEINHKNDDDDDNENKDNPSFVSGMGFPKNVDPQMFINDENKDRCVICNKDFIGHLVYHYVNEHRGCEIYNSRLSPPQIKYVKQGRCKAFNYKSRSYEGFCIFCQKKQRFTLPYWYYHFTRHTGEFAYRCTLCGLRRSMSDFRRHQAQGCPKARVKRDYVCLKTFPIEASVCNLCSYVQLHRINIERHLHSQHNIEQILPEHIQTIPLLSLPTSMTTSSTGRICDSSPGDGEINEIILPGDAETEDFTDDKDKEQMVDEKILLESVEDEKNNTTQAVVNEKDENSADNKSFLNKDVQDLGSSNYTEGDEREFISLEEDEVNKIRDVFQIN